LYRVIAVLVALGIALTWVGLARKRPVYCAGPATVELPCRHNDFLFAADDSGIYRENLKMGRWEKLRLPATAPPGGEFASREGSHEICYYAPPIRSSRFAGGLYQSLDDGDSWKKIYGLGEVCAVYISPGGKTFMLCDVSGRFTQVMVSLDGGRTWRDITPSKDIVSTDRIQGIEAEFGKPEQIACIWYDGIRCNLLHSSDDQYRWDGGTSGPVYPSFRRP
jgi:hypothetical protein